MTLTSRSYSSGHFHLTLDGYDDAGYLRSVSGGDIKGNIIEEKVGPDYTQFKHISTIEISPVQIEVGMAVARPLFDWIKASWNKDYQRKHGLITHATFDQNAMLEQEFTDALITETAFPALDGSSKEPAYLSVKFQPETMDLRKAKGTKLSPSKMPPVEKLWLPSNFQLEIDGLDCSHVNKIDAITVKQKVKIFHTGAERTPQIEPTGIDFGNITIYMAAAHAEPFMQWHQAYVVKGDKDTKHEKQGAIHFLSPQRKGPTNLFSITLQNLGIYSLAIEKSEANAEQIKRIKVELYVEKMDLEYGDGF